MKKEEIKNKLEVCLKKCALSSNQLRKCVNNAMDIGITKTELLTIADEMAAGDLKEEASLCSITAIGQALKYEGMQKKVKTISIKNQDKEEFKNKLKQCFKKCGLARKQLRKHILSSLKSGLKKEELLAMTDDLVGGFGKDHISVCAIVAIDEVLKYEEINKLKKMVKIFAPYMEFPK